MHDPLALRPDLLDSLVALAGAALLQGQMDEACTLIDALRPWRSGSVEVRFFDAVRALMTQDLHEATRLLNALHSQGCGEKSALIECMLALTLQAVDDPTWHQHAQQVMNHPEVPAAVHVAQELLGLDAGSADAPLTGGQSPAPARPRSAAYLRF